MDFIKKAVRRAIRACGYEVARRGSSVGIHWEDNIYRLLSIRPKPVIFDVGANIGQSVESFKNLLPSSVIYSFEPSPNAFGRLQEMGRRYSDVHVNNIALGASITTGRLQENESSVMSSFLAQGKDCWGRIEKETAVPVTTLDSYCAANNIQHIDLLKIDTQGYDLEVAKGARGLMAEGRIYIVLIEIGFADLYKDAPRLDEIYRFFLQNGFRLVSFYNTKYTSDLISECDGVFVCVPGGPAMSVEKTAP